MTVHACSDSDRHSPHEFDGGERFCEGNMTAGLAGEPEREPELEAGQ